MAEVTRQLEADPSNAAELLMRGELHRLRHEWKLAEADYDRAALLDASSLNVYLCRAALYLDQGEAMRAKSVLDHVLAKEPAHLDALKLRAEAWTKLGRPREATRDYDRLLEVSTHPAPDLYLARARAVMACGPKFLDEAVRGLDRGIEHLGPLVSLEFHALELDLQRKDFDRALARLDRVAPQFERQEILLERRGQILAAAGRDREAREAFARALAAIESIPTRRRVTAAVSAMEARLRASLSEGMTVTDPAGISNTGSSAESHR